MKFFCFCFFILCSLSLQAQESLVGKWIQYSVVLHTAAHPNKENKQLSDKKRIRYIFRKDSTYTKIYYAYLPHGDTTPVVMHLSYSTRKKLTGSLFGTTASSEELKSKESKSEYPKLVISTTNAKGEKLRLRRFKEDGKYRIVNNEISFKTERKENRVIYKISNGLLSLEGEFGTKEGSLFILTYKRR